MTNKSIYIHETITIWSDNGEIYLETDNGTVLVFNAETLFNDIPTIMTLALKERKKQEEMILELIADNLPKTKK
jgi:hypothetical protein